MQKNTLRHVPFDDTKRFLTWFILLFETKRIYNKNYEIDSIDAFKRVVALWRGLLDLTSKRKRESQPIEKGGCFIHAFKKKD